MCGIETLLLQRLEWRTSSLNRCPCSGEFRREAGESIIGEWLWRESREAIAAGSARNA